ncbi:MAG: hypothetical protein M1818_005123 [Claussenomyces sp. TS43310]|nr:MAG: hypothetical protein M1818_005123 [Claussenomyces sp. TS43310]
MRLSFIAITIASLLSAGVAQPHHQHRRLHEKRDIVWVTETAIVWETVEMTTTIWIDGESTPALEPTSSPSPAPAQFFQPDTSVSSVHVVPTTTSSSAYIAPHPSSTSTYPAPIISTSAVSLKTSSAVVDTVTPEPSAGTTSYALPSAVSSTIPVNASPVSSANPSVKTCTSDAPCTGDMTYYDASAGTGACGWNNNTMADDVIALPHELMGSLSNDNPYCGLTVSISYGGKEITATVVDKCMGCTGNAIDLSNHAFDQLDAESAGRVTCKWWFN